MFVALLLFVLPSENPFKILKNSGEYKPILVWKDMRERFSWSTVLLLGGGYAMAAGVEKSGLSDFVGRELSRLEFLPEWVFVAFACIIVMCLTEISSNVATSSIFVPLVASIARAHKTNPLLYVLPTTLSSSFAFMFPAGTPPNAIVFSAGFLKVRAGVGLNLFGLFLIMILTHTYAYWLFDLGEMPEWAKIDNSTGLFE